MALGPWDRPPEPLLQGTPTVRATLVTPCPSYCLGPSLGKGNVLRGSGPSFAQVCQWGAYASGAQCVCSVVIALYTA